MKMLSWSRYHCLPKSLLRAKRHCRAADLKARRRDCISPPRPQPPTFGWLRYVAWIDRLLRKAEESRH